MHKTVSSLRGQGDGNKEEETERRGIRDEGRRGSQVKKKERLKGIKKEPTQREDFREL